MFGVCSTGPPAALTSVGSGGCGAGYDVEGIPLSTSGVDIASFGAGASVSTEASASAGPSANDPSSAPPSAPRASPPPASRTGAAVGDAPPPQAPRETEREATAARSHRRERRSPYGRGWSGCTGCHLPVSHRQRTHARKKADTTPARVTAGVGANRALEAEGPRFLLAWDGAAGVDLVGLGGRPGPAPRRYFMRACAVITIPRSSRAGDFRVR